MQRETVANQSDPANQPTLNDPPVKALTPRRCFLVGASVRWAAQSAQRAGFSVIGMDLFGDTDTRAACDTFHLISPQVMAEPKKLRQKINEVSRSYQVQERIVGGIRAFAEPDSPLRLFRLCEGLAISTPPIASDFPWSDAGVGRTPERVDAASQRWPDSRSQWPDSTSRPDSRSQWLLKENESCGGLGVRVWDPTDLNGWQSVRSGKACLQQFIPGRAFGLVAIANGKTTQLLGMTRSLRQRFGAHAFVYSGSFGPVWDPHIPVRAMIELARRVAAEYSIVGLFNLDFIRDRSNRWWLLELNARPSGSCEIIERAAWRSGKLPPNRSLMQLDIEVPEGMIPLWGEDDCTVQYLKQIVYARREGMFAGWAESGSLADIPAPGTKIQKGHPIATFVNEFAIGNSPLWRQIRGNSRRLNQALRCVNV